MLPLHHVLELPLIRVHIFVHALYRYMDRGLLLTRVSFVTCQSESADIAMWEPKSDKKYVCTYVYTDDI